MTGVEMKRLRENTLAYANRKQGLGMMRRATLAQVEYSVKYLPDLHRLKTGATLIIQPGGGGFNYLPGYDGPVTP